MATQPVLIKSVDSSNNILPVSLTASGEVNISSSSLATEATQSAMSSKFPSSLGQTTKSASMSVTLASDQDVLSTSSSQLPSGLGQTTKSASMSVTLASDQDVLSTSSSQLPSSLGQTTKSASMSVTLASDQGTISTSSTLDSSSSSSSLTITSGSTDTSVSKDTAGYSKVGIVVESDKTDTEVQLKWSHDNVTYYPVESKQVVLSIPEVGGGSASNTAYYLASPVAKYVRVDIKNAAATSASVKCLVNLH